MDLKGIIKRIGINPDRTIKDDLRSDYDKHLEGQKYLEKVISENPLKQDIEVNYSAYYDKFYNLLEEGRYSLLDVSVFASKQTDKHLGIFVSAAINKIIREDQEMALYMTVPLDYLFYRFSRGHTKVNIAGYDFCKFMTGGDVKAHRVGNYAFFKVSGGHGEVESAGDYFAKEMENGMVFANKVGDNAFCHMKGGYGEIIEAGSFFGTELENGRVKAHRIGDNAFYQMKGGYAEIDNAGDNLCWQIAGGTITAGKAGNNAFYNITGGSGKVNEAGDNFGKDKKGGKILLNGAEL